MTDTKFFVTLTLQSKTVEKFVGRLRAQRTGKLLVRATNTEGYNGWKYVVQELKGKRPMVIAWYRIQSVYRPGEDYEVLPQNWVLAKGLICG